VTGDWEPGALRAARGRGQRSGAGLGLRLRQRKLTAQPRAWWAGCKPSTAGRAVTAARGGRMGTGREGEGQRRASATRTVGLGQIDKSSFGSDHSRAWGLKVTGGGRVS
jgi:hypothetical protein